MSRNEAPQSHAEAARTERVDQRRRNAYSDESAGRGGAGRFERLTRAHLRVVRRCSRCAGGVGARCSKTKAISQEGEPPPGFTRDGRPGRYGLPCPCGSKVQRIRYRQRANYCHGANGRPFVRTLTVAVSEDWPRSIGRIEHCSRATAPLSASRACRHGRVLCGDRAARLRGCAAVLLVGPTAARSRMTAATARSTGAGSAMTMLRAAPLTRRDLVPPRFERYQSVGLVMATLAEFRRAWAAESREAFSQREARGGSVAAAIGRASRPRSRTHWRTTGASISATVR